MTRGVRGAGGPSGVTSGVREAGGPSGVTSGVGGQVVPPG